MPLPAYSVVTQLQSGLDFLNHFLIRGIGEEGLAGIHGKGGSPFEFTAILGNQVEMQVTAAVTVGTVIDFIRMEGLVDRIGCSGDIFKEHGAFFCADIHQLTDVILIGNNDTAGMALLFKQNQLTDLQVANLNSEACKDVATHAITTITIFRDHFLLFWGYPQTIIPLILIFMIH